MKIKIAVAAIIGLASIGALHSALRAQEEQAARSVWEGVYTEEQARRGAELYAQECASCHGPLLTGTGEEAPDDFVALPDRQEHDRGGGRLARDDRGGRPGR